MAEILESHRFGNQMRRNVFDSFGFGRSTEILNLHHVSTITLVQFDNFQVYDSTTALVKALDLLDKQGKLTFDDPIVECDLEYPSEREESETEDNSEIEKRHLRRRKREEKGDYTIPIMKKFKEGGLIAQAMKQISFDGFSGENISFSISGGPLKNTYTIVNVRAGKYHLTNSKSIQPNILNV